MTKFNKVEAQKDVASIYQAISDSSTLAIKFIRMVSSCDDINSNEISNKDIKLWMYSNILPLFKKEDTAKKYMLAITRLRLLMQAVSSGYVDSDDLMTSNEEMTFTDYIAWIRDEHKELFGKEETEKAKTAKAVRKQETAKASIEKLPESIMELASRTGDKQQSIITVIDNLLGNLDSDGLQTVFDMVTEIQTQRLEVTPKAPELPKANQA